VTSARFIPARPRARRPPAAQHLVAGAVEGELIDHPLLVSHQKLGADDEVGLQQIEAPLAAAHVTQAREIAGAWPPADAAGEPAVHRHRLRRELDAADPSRRPARRSGLSSARCRAETQRIEV